MPGFIDTHLHLFGLSHRAIEPDKAGSIADLQRMVAEKARHLGPGEWITGYGWDEARLTEKCVPTRADLDVAALENPVVLIRAGSHSVVGNSEAFKRAGITKATPDPRGGLIERGANGEPSGIIRERNDLLTALVPPDSFEQLRLSYMESLHHMLELGITSFMEALTSIDDEPYGKGGGRHPVRRARNAWWPLTAGRSCRRSTRAARICLGSLSTSTIRVPSGSKRFRTILASAMTASNWDPSEKHRTMEASRAPPRSLNRTTRDCQDFEAKHS